MNDKVKKLEELAGAIEKEKNIDKAIDSFMEGAAVVKDVLAELETKQGKVFEVVKDIDKYIERETNIE